MSATALSRGVAAADRGRIPVLDIGSYLAGDPGAAAPLARAIARACEDIGFLVIANHGMAPHLVEDTFAVAVQFFARPEADKLALKVGKYNIGYLPFGGQVVRHSPVNRNTRPNFSESFYITRDRAPDHPDIVNQKPLVGLNHWPPDMPEFRAATTAYYRAMEAMTTRLVPIVALALDLPADYFSEAFAKPNCTIRLIHYPPHPDPEENEFGFAPHTDNNFLTFSRSRHYRVSRCAPPRVSGSSRRQCRGLLSSTPGRCWRATRTTASGPPPTASSTETIPRAMRSRSFSGRTTDTVVDCVPTCVGPDNPPHYEPTIYGAFTRRLLSLNVAHRRAEDGGEYG